MHAYPHARKLSCKQQEVARTLTEQAETVDLAAGGLTTATLSSMAFMMVGHSMFFKNS